jgi:dipeptidase D
MPVLSNYNPNSVFHFFEEISAIPRGSYNEKAVSDYCVQFAKDRNLEVYQDEIYNVVIIKPASPGYEDAEPVIIQGHLDMVCEKTPGSSHDFERDGLKLYVDGDFIKAEGTTLGGDDGIAVAFALAILDDDSIEHPRLEVVFTVSEEVGMDGAAGIDLSMLRGRRMLNLDSEEEGCLLTGCAGGNSSVVTLPVQYMTVPAGNGTYQMNGEVCELRVSGLLGGHSGVEIDKNRANANVVIGRCLMAFERTNQKFDLISLGGGHKENVIPNEAFAKVVLYDYPAAEQVISGLQETLLAEYRNTDPDISVTIQKITEESDYKIVTEQTKYNIMLLLCGMPNGIQKMSGDISGLVETSLNLGIMEMEENVLTMCYSVRSSIGGSKEYITNRIRTIAGCAGATLTVRGDYPAWEYKADSRLREDMVRIYEEMYGQKPVVQAIHAGLECGLLAEKLPGLDCVSFGPNIYDIHSVKERLSISSVQRVWEYTLRVLKCK